MNIHNFFYNEKTRSLHVEFSMKDDADSTYRHIDLIYEDVAYYAPTIILENDMPNIIEEEIIEILQEYFNKNDLPEEQFL